MNLVNEIYISNLRRFQPIDGLKAIIAYINYGGHFFQGWLYTMNLSAGFLNASQVPIALALIATELIYLACSIKTSLALA